MIFNTRRELFKLGYKRLVAEIDLDALDFNIKSIIKKVGQKAKIIGTIKADGYGHGAWEVAKVLMANGVDMFSVAMLDEAVNLRNDGLDKPILILGTTPPEYYSDIVKYDITQQVSSLSQAEGLNKTAENLGKKVSVHIALDTGMGRIGFAPCEKSIDDIIKISSMKNLEITGLFTHFSTSDEKDKTYTLEQKKKYMWTVTHLEEKGVHIPFKHIANSAAIMDFNDLMFDAVRPGIILYGLYPSKDVIKKNLPLKPVMSLKARINYIKTVDKDTSISYGRTYRTEGKKTIATIPAGYADGYSRLLSNKGHILISGKRAPIIGRICMDQFMADISGIEADEWDEAVLMGRQGNEEITADEIADAIGTINYEVVCMINKRVPRVYIKGGKVVKVINLLV
ncbi:MAG: alanine racemase [Clostridia bacterium]|jgi:alanine racemase|nr:alanine racemase [Clostridia bacterium]MCI1999046.1 alanine racemase [Clostridia bacterium]MCI2013796.1 alanine racemase [Clostridia bacterium]